MIPPRPTELAHLILRPVIHTGDTVIDATAGNGHDTVFLAECVGDAGKVHAFDIQPKAIDSARRRVAQAGLGKQVEFHQTCHTRMDSRIAPGSASVVMFNLGYLPGESHALTTGATGTLDALETAAAILRPGGILSVVCYPGHDEGASEAENTSRWFESLPGRGWRVSRYGILGTRRPAPFLLIGLKP